jgi:hypothetical protein
MPTLTIQYVYFGASGIHTRQPRAITSYGGFTPIPGLGPGTATLMTGTAYQPGPALPSVTVGSLTLQFAFVNVCGCTEGGLTSFVASTPPPVGTVGTSPILVNYVYLPVGGGPPGTTTGAVIDAYNETSGTLVDNDFVTVSPDPGGTLTTEANVDGWVDTTDSSYTIAADHPNIGPYLADPTNLLFDQWVDLATPTPPAGLVSGADLTPGKGVTVYALAFYKLPSTSKLPKEVKENPWGEKVRSKDWEKEYPGSKEVTDTPLKSPLEGIKGPKESVEGYGPGQSGDPAIAAQMRQLNQRVSQLESNAASQGTAFIKPQDRPSVKPQT